MCTFTCRSPQPGSLAQRLQQWEISSILQLTSWDGPLCVKAPQGEKERGGMVERGMDGWKVRDAAECIHQTIMKQDIWYRLEEHCWIHAYLMLLTHWAIWLLLEPAGKPASENVCVGRRGCLCVCAVLLRIRVSVYVVFTMCEWEKRQTRWRKCKYWNCEIGRK